MPENNDTLIKILETLQALQYQQNIESLSIEDIVQKYKFGHNKVYQMFQDSRLKKYKEGKKYLVLKSDFEEIIKNGNIINTREAEAMEILEFKAESGRVLLKNALYPSKKRYPSKNVFPENNTFLN